MKLIYSILFFVLLPFTNCFSATQQSDPIPEYETFIVKSKQVNEDRVINVWTPEGYKTNSKPLPVLYMADGGIKEDFPHVATTLSQLIKEQKIKPLILVGIENTQRRRDLTGFTEVAEDKEIAPVVGGSEKFRSFIREELFPEIDKRYRTTTEKSILGESLSGLFVMETFFLAPEMFDNYIAFDPSFWWNNHYLVRTAKEHFVKFPRTKKRLWFASSDVAEISLYSKELVGVLKSENLKALKWNYSDEPKENHSTIFRAAKEKALIWTLNKTK